MQVTAGSERVNKELFPALLIHFLFKRHQIKIIRRRGKNPGFPFSLGSIFMAIISDAFLFVNLFLQPLCSWTA